MEAVRALIASKKVDPSALAKQAKETEAGLRQSASDALLTPEEALLWRAVCEHLCAEQARLSRGAAVGTGYPAALDAAAATKLEDALEDALPPSGERHRLMPASSLPLQLRWILA